MRVCGRLLRPSSLQERRLLLGHFGASYIRVPRKQNIFAVARRIERYLKKNDDVIFFRKLAAKTRTPPVSPDVDLPVPSPDGEEDVAAAE